MKFYAYLDSKCNNGLTTHAVLQFKKQCIWFIRTKSFRFVIKIVHSQIYEWRYKNVKTMLIQEFPNIFQICCQISNLLAKWMMLWDLWRKCCLQSLQISYRVVIKIVHSKICLQNEWSCKNHEVKAACRISIYGTEEVKSRMQLFLPYIHFPLQFLFPTTKSIKGQNCDKEDPYQHIQLDSFVNF